MTEFRRYRGVLRTEIDVDGNFTSYKEFKKAVETMWNAGGYWIEGHKAGLDAEENWIELNLIEVDPPLDEDEEDDYGEEVDDGPV